MIIFMCNHNVNFYHGELEQLKPSNFPCCVGIVMGTFMLCFMFGVDCELGLGWASGTGIDVETTSLWGSL